MVLHSDNLAEAPPLHGEHLPVLEAMRSLGSLRTKRACTTLSYSLASAGKRNIYVQNVPWANGIPGKEQTRKFLS